jgi:hypothetical protein
LKSIILSFKAKKIGIKEIRQIKRRLKKADIKELPNRVKDLIQRQFKNKAKLEKIVKERLKKAGITVSPKTLVEAQKKLLLEKLNKQRVRDFNKKIKEIEFKKIKEEAIQNFNKQADKIKKGIEKFEDFLVYKNIRKRVPLNKNQFEMRTIRVLTEGSKQHLRNIRKLKEFIEKYKRDFTKGKFGIEGTGRSERALKSLRERLSELAKKLNKDKEIPKSKTEIAKEGVAKAISDAQKLNKDIKKKQTEIKKDPIKTKEVETKDGQVLELKTEKPTTGKIKSGTRTKEAKRKPDELKTDKERIKPIEELVKDAPQKSKVRIGMILSSIDKSKLKPSPKLKQNLESILKADQRLVQGIAQDLKQSAKMKQRPLTIPLTKQFTAQETRTILEEILERAIGQATKGKSGRTVTFSAKFKKQLETEIKKLKKKKKKKITFLFTPTLAGVGDVATKVTGQFTGFETRGSIIKLKPVKVKKYKRRGLKNVRAVRKHRRRKPKRV